MVGAIAQTTILQAGRMMIGFRLNRTMRRSLLFFALSLALACGGRQPAGPPIGSKAPTFRLPGVDGHDHSLDEYAKSQVLALVFTCNSCPVSQLYEARLKGLHDTYRDKGITLVAINSNPPGSMTLDDLSRTDVGESLDDMKIRAEHRRLEYAYLSDGDTQALTRQLGVTTLPHIFVFDQARTLRYHGRVDDNPREELVAAHDARDAIDSLLGGRPVPASRTLVSGCPVKPLGGRDEQLAAIETAPVKVEAIEPDGVTKLRHNGTGKLLMINFWATWCAPCVSEFPDLETTYRMYRKRDLEFVTVSVNDPAERPAVVAFLQQHHAAHTNWQFATPDIYGLQAAFDPNLPAPVPLTLVLAPNGDVLYQELGASNIPRLRRAILANLSDDAKSPNMQSYWLEKPS